MILTSQLPVSRWHEQIGDPTLADGILDRLVHNPIASRCAANRCANSKARKGKNEHESAGEKLWKRPGKERPWKSLRDFHFSHSFNHNKLDDRDHFPENPITSGASLRRLITLILER